jgi:hypothetical protein
MLLYCDLGVINLLMINDFDFELTAHPHQCSPCVYLWQVGSFFVNKTTGTGAGNHRNKRYKSHLQRIGINGKNT